MLLIYGVGKEIKQGAMHSFDFLVFYLRRADAEAYVKNCNEKDVKVVPLEVKEDSDIK